MKHKQRVSQAIALVLSHHTCMWRYVREVVQCAHRCFPNLQFFLGGRGSILAGVVLCKGGEGGVVSGVQGGWDETRSVVGQAEADGPPVGRDITCAGSLCGSGVP